MYICQFDFIRFIIIVIIISSLRIEVVNLHFSKCRLHFLITVTIIIIVIIVIVITWRKDIS